MKLTFYVHQQ
jgi:hypothetical protein